MGLGAWITIINIKMAHYACLCYPNRVAGKTAKLNSVFDIYYYYMVHCSIIQDGVTLQ